mgnify:CR=1 FL=1
MKIKLAQTILPAAARSHKSSSPDHLPKITYLQITYQNHLHRSPTPDHLPKSPTHRSPTATSPRQGRYPQIRSPTPNHLPYATTLVAKPWLVTDRPWGYPIKVAVIQSEKSSIFMIILFIKMLEFSLCITATLMGCP